MKNLKIIIVLVALASASCSLAPANDGPPSYNWLRSAKHAVIGKSAATQAAEAQAAAAREVQEAEEAIANNQRQAYRLAQRNVNHSKETFESLTGSSRDFNEHTCLFPTQNNRIQNIAGSDERVQQTIVNQANGVRPIIHADVLVLIDRFLDYKREDGSSIEKALYANMTRDQFIDRLLINRPLTFWLPYDQYLTRNDEKGRGGFENIGTNNEQPPLVLQDYLSYDEMQIAALIGVSVPTFFINNGDRKNSAQPGAAGTFQQTGVYVGLVGARFEKPGRMEYTHLLIQDGADPRDDRFSSIWAQFYESKTHSGRYGFNSGRMASIMPERYQRLPEHPGLLFDKLAYKKRIRMVAEPFLLEANSCGEATKKKAYCHVVGLGLGVWQLDAQLQSDLMLDVYKEILESRPVDFISIGDLDFSWFTNASEAKKQELIACGEQMRITIHFSKRNPADKLTGENAGKLLVAMYAWDSNAYPGNEYWVNALTASGDPAAACCSTIPELQNPLINSNVSARNLFVAQPAKAGLSLREIEQSRFGGGYQPEPSSSSSSLPEREMHP